MSDFVSTPTPYVEQKNVYSHPSSTFMGVSSFSRGWRFQRMAFPLDIVPRRAAGSTRMNYYPVCAEGSLLGDGVTLVWWLPLSLRQSPCYTKTWSFMCILMLWWWYSDITHWFISFILFLCFNILYLVIRIIIRILVFWTLIPYTFGDIYQFFFEYAASFFRVEIDIHLQSTRCHIVEDHKLNTGCCGQITSEA